MLTTRPPMPGRLCTPTRAISYIRLGLGSGCTVTGNQSMRVPQGEEARRKRTGKKAEVDQNEEEKDINQEVTRRKQFPGLGRVGCQS